jgi:hypothetical protein
MKYGLVIQFFLAKQYRQMRNRIEIAFFYFFNSFLLPLGLNFTTLFSPLFVIQLFKDKNSLKYAKQFLVVLLLFVPFHIINGVSYFQYFKSLLLFLSCVIFYNYIQTYLLETRIDRVFRFISKMNIYLTGVAILVFFTPYKDILWYNSIYTAGIETASRLRMFTLESAVYSLFLVPLFLFYFIRVQTINLKSDRIGLVIISIPLVLSLSFGVIGMLSFVVCFFFIYRLINTSIKNKTKKTKSIQYLFLALIVLLILSFFFIFPNSNIAIRVSNIISGDDSSGNGRIFEPWILAYQIIQQKSLLLGIGIGQLNIIGYDIIDSFYNLYGANDKVALPNVVVETFLFYGIIGLFVRFYIILSCAIRTKVFSSPYRFMLFSFMFLYQFTGSNIMNVIEYAIWAMAFSPVLDKYFNDSSKIIFKEHPL